MAEALTPEFLGTIPLRDRKVFEFYYNQTAGETLDVKPEYTWDQFAALGYAPFQETDTYTLDYIHELAGGKDDAAGLVPNYRERIGEYPAMLDAFKGRAGDAIATHTSMGRAAILNCSHPSLATPILVADAAIDAYGPDVRKRLYIVYGLLPTVFEYALGEKEMSPVGIARASGNVLLTAAKTPSNEATNEADRDEIEHWQQGQRATFKEVFDTVTTNTTDGEGPLVILCVTGQRFKGGSVLRPDGSLDYLHGKSVWSVGVEDNLLGPELVSHVWMQVAVEPVEVANDRDVHASNAQTCELASHGNSIFPYETRFEHTRRLVASGAIPPRMARQRKPPLHLG